MPTRIKWTNHVKLSVPSTKTKRAGRNLICVLLLFQVSFSLAQEKKNIIFAKTDTIQNWKLSSIYERFTPTTLDVKRADSIAYNYIKNNRDEYYWAKEITGLQGYYRQYVGYFDQNNSRIIFLNCFSEKRTVVPSNDLQKVQAEALAILK